MSKHVVWILVDSNGRFDREQKAFHTRERAIIASEGRDLVPIRFEVVGGAPKAAREARK